MRFPPTDPLPVPRRPMSTFIGPGGSVDLDRAWVNRAALHVIQTTTGPLGISPALAAFLADCDPADEAQRIVIAAARRQAQP